MTSGPQGARRVARVMAVCVIASFAASGATFLACTYPDFAFGPVDDDGGGRGVGGAAQGGSPIGSGGTDGGQGGFPTTSSGHQIGGEAGQTGAGGEAVTVPCQPGPSVECGVGEACCFHKTDETQDKCAPAGTCGMDFNEFTCNTQSDCATGICCATVTYDITFEAFPEAVKCEPTCNGSDRLVICDEDSECNDGTCDAFAFNYPGYGWCDL